MASSQVEIASSSPFGCVLRDRNHRDGCRESNVKATHAVLQRNIKNFVMDHLNTCMSMSPDSPTNENENHAGSWVSNASSKNNNNTTTTTTTNNNNNNNLGNLRFTRMNRVNNKDESSLASLISPRHSRLLDRWAARQARAMVSTLENEVELLSMDNNSSSSSSMLGRTCSSASDDTSSEISNLGASSLVQIWEKRLNQSNGSKPNTPVSNGRASPSFAAATNNCHSALSSDAGRSCYLPAAAANEELSSFADWESHSDHSFSPQGRWSSSEAADGDRVSVADIIKRLTSPNPGQSPPPMFGDDSEHEGCTSSVTNSPCTDFASENLEQKAFPQVTCSPRIRRRRAFNDLLMQLERDRHGELNNLAERRAVSRFTQRGRIQSLLRLKLLQRGVAANDQAAANDKCRQKSTLSRENRQPHESAIMQLRERFSTAAEQKTTVHAEASCPRSSSLVEIADSTMPLDNSPATNQPSKDTHSQAAHESADNTAGSIQISVSQTNVDPNKEQPHTSSHVTFQGTRIEVQHDDLQETAKATTSMTDSDINEVANKAETSNQNYAVVETTYEETVEEEEARDQHYAESSYDDMVEEVEALDQNYDEISYDWISEISRPRSYWEERRQAWYREMLDTGSQNEDIRHLLERRTVSTFLSSNFRETMDRLMKSHRGTQTQLVNSQDDAEDNQGYIAILQDRMSSASTPEENGRDGEDKEEGDERRNEDEEEEEENLEQQEEQERYEVGDYFHQPSSPSPSRSWSYRDNEAGDDFDRVVSTSSQPSQSQSFSQSDRPCSSSTNHNSIEMELIYDLRGQMEQLYHEMSELRKSIKSCVDMQMQLQQSMNQEFHTVKKEEKKSHTQAPKKGNCCICYDMKVDSLLYRCGHMCACLKCANELQWNGGKCPICRAKIVDVVRVYVDT